jgi:hypothetical protein
VTIIEIVDYLQNISEDERIVEKLKGNRFCVAYRIVDTNIVTFEYKKDDGKHLNWYIASISL